MEKVVNRKKVHKEEMIIDLVGVSVLYEKTLPCCNTKESPYKSPKKQPRANELITIIMHLV